MLTLTAFKVTDEMMKYIARFILKLFGWTVRGELPADRKAVVISIPHTSIMDFVWGKLTYMSRGIPTTIMIKKEFFFFPLGYLLRALGAIPVDRGNRENHLVERMVEEFKKREVMYLTITPEGSRKKRKRWKKGFLVIAREAGVPVYLGRIDYKYKFCTWGPRFEPTGDDDADLRYIMSTYRTDVHPHHPECFSAGD